MIKINPKKWGTRIILSAMLSIFLVMNAPIQNQHVAYAETAQEKAVKMNEICQQLFKVQCSNVSEDQFETKRQELGVESKMTFAAWKASTDETSVDEKIAKQTKKSLEFLVGMQKVLNRLIWPILIMTGGLMDNSLLFGSGMEARLREIWVPIRNIVNILFVIVLIGIALYNVLGIGDENGTYSIKAILPKLIVGIIVVNFSFLGIKVFLDAINILTVSIFAIPSQIDEGLGKILAAPNSDQSESIKRMCLAMKDKNGGEKITQEELQKADHLIIRQVVAQKYQYKFSKEFKGNKIMPGDGTSAIDKKVNTALKGNPGAIAQYEEDLKIKEDGRICDGRFLTPQGVIFLNRWNSRNAALAMALNMGKIVFYEDVDLTANNVDKLVINSVFSVMMWLIYAASFIALFVVLLARLVVMWLAIALSPVLMLMIAVPAIKEQISGFGEISSKFVQNAIAPLGIALSMTVGWVMLRALQSVNSISGANTRYLDFTNGFPVVGLSTIQDLVVALGTVAVVWLGVFSAASSSIAAPVTDAMKNGLQKAGSWVGTLPLKHAPLFPIEIAGHKENFTGEQILTAMSDLGDSSRERNKLSDIIRDETNTKPDVLLNKDKIKDAKTAAKVINGNKVKFNGGDAYAIDSLVKMQHKNRTAWKDMINKTGSAGATLEAAVEKYGDNPNTKGAAAELGKAATKWAKGVAGTETYKGDKPDTKPVAAGATSAANATPTQTKDSVYGGHKLSEYGGDDANGTRIAKNMKEAADAVREGLESGKMKTLEQVASALNHPEVRPSSVAELKQLLGSTIYTKLETLLSSKGIKPEDFVKNSLMNNDSAAPAAPAAPAPAVTDADKIGQPEPPERPEPPIDPTRPPSDLA